MRKIVSLSIVLTLALFACKKSETTSGSTATTVTTATTATTATVAPAPQPTATTATTASAAPTAGAIAGADGEISGAHIDITELKRTSGGNVNLKFVISYNGPKEFPMAGHFLGDGSVSKDSYRGVSGIHLVDPVNKKKYFVVTDSEKNCLCSKEVGDIRPGERTAMWAKFPAPPPDVTKVTIEVPHFQPMDDVPISQ
jgi:hypothetical protein